MNCRWIIIYLSEIKKMGDTQGIILQKLRDIKKNGRFFELIFRLRTLKLSIVAENVDH